MLKDVTLGQYFPGSTIVHRLDPRVKLILTIVYITALFLAKSYYSYALMLAVLASCIILSKLSLRTVLSGLKPIIVIIVITALLNLFTLPGDELFHVWIFRATYQGLRTAVFMAVRLMMLITGTFLLTYTTSPIALTDGIESLLGPLKKIRLPVHELAMMMSIALRMIPTLIEETDKIMSAQRARGADFETGGLIKRARALLPLIIPLFVSAFRRADELATAMESRCYHGGEGRTRMKVLRYKPRDLGAVLCAAAVTAGVVVLARYGL